MTSKNLITLLGIFIHTLLVGQGNAKLDKNLVAILDTIYHTDQNQLTEIYKMQKEFGYDSNETATASALFRKNHSVHLAKVEKILSERGWLGADVVGEQGNWTLFLIIQHSDLKIKLKYFSMIKEACAKGNAPPRDLALLEDRVASEQGKLQIYGNTIKRYSESGIFDVWPIIDPENVDKRRASVGIEPIAPYIKRRFGIIWDLEKQKARTAAFLAEKEK